MAFPVAFALIPTEHGTWETGMAGSSSGKEVSKGLVCAQGPRPCLCLPLSPALLPIGPPPHFQFQKPIPEQVLQPELGVGGGLLGSPWCHHL